MADRRLWLALALLLAGCLHPAPRPQAGALPPLLPPASLGAERGAEQMLSGSHGERRFSLRCVLTARHDKLSVLGLMPWGQTAFTVSYDGQALDAERSATVPEAFDPNALIADLQLALWPIDALRAAYEGSGWQLDEPVPGVRRLLADGRAVTQVHYAGDDAWNGRFWLVSWRHGYTLAVDSHELPVD